MARQHPSLGRAGGYVETGLHGRPARPASAAQAADWPRLAGALGRLLHALPRLRDPARQRPCHLVVDAGVSVSVSKDFSKGFAAAAAAESSGSGSGSSSAKDSSAKHKRTGSWPFGRKTPQK